MFNGEFQALTTIWKWGDAVRVCAENWRAIQETLYLASVHGMTESMCQARSKGPQIRVAELHW